MSADHRKLRILTGCTAVGKTEWSLRWAEQNNAEIVSCDSLLFYRGADIGTAKPTREELARVPHHLIDVCDLNEQMNVNRYVGLAQTALTEIVARGQAALVVGGSGFYLKSFFGAVADEVAVSPELRAEVMAMPLGAAVARLRELNPEGLGGLDIANPRRVTRALERCLASGETLAALMAKFSAIVPPFAHWQVELTQIERDPTELDTRIAERVATMIRNGLIDEVRSLAGRHLRENPSASRAIGYREVLRHLDGELSAGELPGEIEKNTRALVKKQRTWFRTQLPPHRVLRADTIRNAAELFS